MEKEVIKGLWVCSTSVAGHSPTAQADWLWKKRSYLLAIAIATMVFAACRQTPVVELEDARVDSLKENLINANRHIAQSEETQIDAYIGRRGWNPVRLMGGARVEETSKGTGKPIGYEDTVAISYSVEAINGALIYSETDDTVVVGRLKPTRGLDAALQTLHYGSTARVILPSEQAYGVVGDGDRIGTRMVLVYLVKVKGYGL